MCTFIRNSHDGRGQTVLGGRAVFLVCCVLILCPFCLLMVSSKFAEGVCSTIFCSRRAFSMRFKSGLFVICRKCCSSVDAWIAMLVAESSNVQKQQKIA